MAIKYTPVIGLEIHVELKTESKMFCQCAADYFGKEPNTNTCPVCLGLPGALPVPNKKAVESTILIGKALNCQINTISKFDRKHYFYPDLPKGYQISQYDEPIAVNGLLDLKSEQKSFRIRRVHLEEDTAKLIHRGEDTLIDFNRSGVPLVEIVTEPDFTNADDVKEFLGELQLIIRYLSVSDADMEKGSMRLEPNISLIKGTDNIASLTAITLPNYKVEIKNINSFRYVKQAIEYEIKRQTAILEKNETPKQETRGFDEKKVATYAQRSKEEAHDYRYFPEPDIPPMTFSQPYLETIFAQIPELPAERRLRYETKYAVKRYDAAILVRDVQVSEYFEKIIAHQAEHTPKTKEVQYTGQQIANIIINKKISPDLSVRDFMKELSRVHSPVQTDEKLLSTTIAQVIKTNAEVVADYKKGKTNAIMFLVGQVMRAMKGQADAIIVRKRLEREI